MRRPNKLNLWLTLFTLTLAAMFGVNVASGTSDLQQKPTSTPTTTRTHVPVVPFQTPIPQPACPPNCAYLKSGRTNEIGSGLRMIIKIKGDFKSEAQLTSDEIKLQQNTIRNNQQILKQFVAEKKDANRLSGTGIDAMYYKMPFIGINLDGDYNLLDALSSHPLVERIVYDEPLGEYFDMGTQDVEIDLQALSSQPLPSFQLSTNPKKEKCFPESCAQLLLNAIKYGYARVVILPKQKYGDISVSREYEYARSMLYRQGQTKALIAIQEFLLNAQMLRADMGSQIIIAGITYEGLQILINDPYIEQITALWYELQPDRRYSQPHSDAPLKESGSTATASSTATTIPTTIPSRLLGIGIVGLKDKWVW